MAAVVVVARAFEVDESGLYGFGLCVWRWPGRTGKPLVLLILALWHIYALDSRTVIGTAQDLTTSEKSWGEAVQWATENDELAPLIEQVIRSHPKVLKLITGCEYRVATSSRRGGRGFSGDLILMDELREHQSWDSWASVTNTMNARPRAQCWAFSNAGDSLSVVLRYLRACAHRDLGWPDGDADASVLDGAVRTSSWVIPAWAGLNGRRRRTLPAMMWRRWRRRIRRRITLR